MGGIIQWIITNAQRISAWALAIAAIASVLVAVSDSNVYREVSNNATMFKRLVTTGCDKVNTVVSSMNRAVSTAANDDTSGWVNLIFYMVYLDGWGELMTFLAANFEAVLVSTFFLAAACAGLAVVVFLYSRKRLLANAVAGTPLLTT